MKYAILQKYASVNVETIISDVEKICINHGYHGEKLRISTGNNHQVNYEIPDKGTVFLHVTDCPYPRGITSYIAMIALIGFSKTDGTLGQLEQDLLKLVKEYKS